MNTHTQCTDASRPGLQLLPHASGIVLAVLLLVTSSLCAATYTVQMTGGLFFSPDPLSIGQGDSVTWTNTALFAHTSTSGSAPTPNGLWDSSSVDPSSSFTVNFSNFAGGSYPYFCSFHWHEGMTGTLTITNATTSPAVLSAPSWKTNQFEFTVDGPIGQSYIIETSFNLTN